MEHKTLEHVLADLPEDVQQRIGLRIQKLSESTEGLVQQWKSGSISLTECERLIDAMLAERNYFASFALSIGATTGELLKKSATAEAFAKGLTILGDDLVLLVHRLIKQRDEKHWADVSWVFPIERWQSARAGIGVPDPFRLRIKLTRRDGALLQGHWFWLLPADECAEKALQEHVKPRHREDQP